MERKVAQRSDGVIAVVTSNRKGWAHGYILERDGTRSDWPLPIATLLARGSWTALPERDGVQLTPDD